MKLSDDARKKIANEFKYVAKSMREEKDIMQKIYFFSATYAMVQRIFNLEFDPYLVLMHNVLQNTYMTINGVLIAITTGQERAIKIPNILFSSLADATDALGDAILKEKDTTEALQKIATLSFAATGNGYYLCQKGTLKI